MSCCGGNCGGGKCGCGSSCKCCSGSGSGCGRCTSGESTSETLVVGVAPQKGHIEGFEATAGSENGGCKCGSSCTCDPCTCK